jgi:hypothetical protein
MTEPAPQPTPPPAAPDPPKADPPPAPDLAQQLKDSQAALESERRMRTRLDAELTKTKQGQMNDAEKAIAKARDEGKLEGVKAAGIRLAAAEFRARATGKIGDPAAIIDHIDLTKFVDDHGEPDTKAIDAVVEKLAAAMPAAPANGTPPAPKVPGGPRPDPPEDDWLRSVMSGKS